MQKKIYPLILLLTGGLITSCTSGGGGSTPATSTDSSSSSTPVVCPAEDEGPIHLVILAGQSGARGKALNTDLDGSESDYENYDVDIIADGLMMPQLTAIPSTISASADIDILEPGYGDTSAEFGPELGMGQTLASRYPKDGATRRSVIIKYTASGSTFTDHWYSKSALADTTINSYIKTTQQRTDKNGDNTGPLTNNLYQLIDRTVDLLETEGYETVIDGATFIHGEQDAKFDDNMTIYEKCLTYFINDLRAYVEDEDMPVVITEALTNSAKYSNTLREIQADVASTVDNCSFLDNSDLYTNTFEPWHYGANSNFEVGNRIAAELVSLNDYREIETIDTPTINVPKGVDVELPTYLDATFTNDYTGKVKVEYVSEYNKDQLGEQTVEVEVNYANCRKEKHEIKVNVTEEPYVDGKISDDEYPGLDIMDVGYGEIVVAKGAEGLYVGAKINDTDLWTDGEAWGTGDMGQNAQNDDFRIYVTTGNDLTNKYQILLSAANLLRIYGAEVTSLTQTGLPGQNLIYSKLIGEYQYRVTTFGIVNNEGENSSEGFELEFYIPYFELGIDDPDTISMLFNYNNVTQSGGNKSNTNHYWTSGGASSTAGAENDFDNYIPIAHLVS